MSDLESVRSIVDGIRENPGRGQAPRIAAAPGAQAADSGLVRFPAHLMVEPSYACNLRCVMCPRHFEGAAQGLMPPEFFAERVQPALGEFRYVSFVGWGEPLLNSHLPEYLAAAKAAGAFTLIITNGLLLRGAMAARTLASGLDMVCVSIDAARPETYETVRGRGHFARLMENVRAFAAQARARPEPLILSWVFVTMKSNIRELPQAVDLAGESGFTRFYIKHMECATSRAELSQALWNTGLAPDLTADEQALYEDTLADALTRAEHHGLEVIRHPQRHAPEGMCLVQPLDNVFVDWEGYVSPCCYLNRLDMRPYLKEKPASNGVLGAARPGVTLLDLLRSPAYAEFQRRWREGAAPECCSGCLNTLRMRTTSPA